MTHILELAVMRDKDTKVAIITILNEVKCTQNGKKDRKTDQRNKLI